MLSVRPLTIRVVVGFIFRSAFLHLVTYLVIGALSYRFLAHRLWEGDTAIPGLRDPRGQFIQFSIFPAQIFRGVIHGFVFLPLRRTLINMKHGGILIALILLLIGSIGGINGAIETWLYTTGFNPKLFFAHLPEIVIQTVLFGYLLLAWERRLEKTNALSVVASA
jgi:hypothetical protein